MVNKWIVLLRRQLLGWLTVLAAAPAMAVSAITPASGQWWMVPDGIAGHAVPANVPTRTPDVTFNVFAPFDFSSFGTVSDFLSSGQAFDVLELTPGTLNLPASDGVISSLLRFAGFIDVVNGQQFTVTHDDGLSLMIGGLDLGLNSGPTPPVTSIATYNGPSGNLPFELVYGDCCAGNAVLQVGLQFTTPVPEPASIAMLMGGLALVGWRSRRAMRQR